MTGQELDAFRRFQGVGIKPKPARQLSIQPDQPRIGHGRGLQARKKPLRQAGEAVVELNLLGGCHRVADCTFQ